MGQGRAQWLLPCRRVALWCQAPRFGERRREDQSWDSDPKLDLDQRGAASHGGGREGTAIPEAMGDRRLGGPCPVDLSKGRGQTLPAAHEAASPAPESPLTASPGKVEASQWAACCRRGQGRAPARAPHPHGLHHLGGDLSFREAMVLPGLVQTIHRPPYAMAHGSHTARSLGLLLGVTVRMWCVHLVTRASGLGSGPCLSLTGFRTVAPHC